MRSIRRKIIAWGLISAITVSLTACGISSNAKNANTDTDQDSLVFSGEVIGRDEVTGNPDSYFIAEDKIYFVSAEYEDYEEETDSENEEDYVDPGITRVYTMNLDGTGISEVCKPALGKEDGFIHKLMLDQDKSILLFSSSYDEKTQTQHFYMIRTDESGSVKEHVDLAEAIGIDPDSYITDFCIDEKGDYIVITDHSALILDHNYKIMADVKNIEGWIEGAAKTPDGKIVCAVMTGQGVTVRELDVEGKKFGKAAEIEADYISGSNSLQDGRGEYDMFFTTDLGVFGYSFKNQTSTKILDYMASEIPSDNAYGIVPIDSETMIGTDWEGSVGHVILYKKADPDQAEDKITITFGSMWGIVDEVKTAAIKFNKENDKYKIEFKDYSGTEDCETRMTADILAGNAPDILDLSYIPVEPFVTKGILEDLTPYLEKDDMVSKEDLLPSVEKAMEIDGKLYYVSSSFNVKTVLASKKDVGDKTGWTYEELKALLDEKGEGVSPFQSVNKVDNLNTFIHANINDFIDWDKGECRFNSDEFKEMLEIANRGTTEEMVWDEAAGEMQSIKDGKVLFWEGYANPEYLQGFKGACGSDVTYIGYPCDDKNGSYFSMNNQIGIYSKSKVKEGAWEFLRLFLTKEFQAGDGYMFSNPTNKEAFEMFMKSRTATKSYKDEFGFKITPVKETWELEDGAIKIGPLTEEEEKQYRDLIASTSKTVTFDDTILNIINEEAEEYFNGQRGLDETADLIQNRVTTYVNEKR